MTAAPTPGNAHCRVVIVDDHPNVRAGLAALIDAAPDLACAAIDVQGTSWVGASGRLFFRGARPDASWIPAWESPAFRAPFVSLRADPGVVTAMTVDGAVLEGRAPVGA